MTQNAIDISVVIINYNSERFIKDNLDSLLTQSIPFKQIIVVDNHSTDRSLEILKHYENQITVIPLSYNSGYAAGANTGINQSDSALVLVANSDIILAGNFNATVITAFSKDEELSLLSPLILRFDRNTVDSAGQACSASLHPAEIGYNQPLSQVDIQERPVFSVCGAATVFRRSALEHLKIQTQYYDEDFFIFWEDFDLGWRAQLLGLKTIFFPGARVYHYRSGTLRKNFFSRFSLALARPAEIKYHLVKNRYLTLIKNFRWKTNFRNLPFVFLKDIIWVPLLTFSSPKIIIELMKSVKFIKRALQKRKQIKQQAGTGRVELSKGSDTHA